MTLRGRITDAKTGNPIDGAFILVDQNGGGTTSQANGTYRLTMFTGRHILFVRLVGYEDFEVRVRALSDDTLDFAMTPAVLDLKETVITGKAPDENVREVSAGLAKLSIKEISAMPTLMGEVDIFRSLQTLPGVQTVGEGAGGLNIRGGRIDQNLVLQNGAMLYNPSHVLGFFSTFNPDVVENFSLYKGHVPAQYGGRISSVLDVETKRPSLERYSVKGGIGPIAGRIAIELPVWKEHTGLLLGGRFTYSDWLLRQIYDPNVSASAANFYDFNGFLMHKFSAGTTLTLGYTQSYDYFRFADDFGYGYATKLAQAHLVSVIRQGLALHLRGSWGRYTSEQFAPTGPLSFRLNNGINYWQTKAYAIWKLNEKHQFNLGLEAVRNQGRTESVEPYTADSARQPAAVTKEGGLELSAFANDEWNLNDKLGIEIGLRYTRHLQLGTGWQYAYQADGPRREETLADSTWFGPGQVASQYGGFEPRFSMRYTLSKNSSIKFSLNRMYQYIHLISNTSAASPVDLWQVSNRYLPPQVANGVSLGYFRNFNDNATEFSVEGYFKLINNLVEYRDFASLLVNRHIETELLAGHGRAFGIEGQIKQNKGRWTGWLSYAYARALVRIDDPYRQNLINLGSWFPANFDKPHSLNLVAKYAFTPYFSFNANFSYSTGRPFTALVSNYQVSGIAVPHYSGRNQYRVPDYIRLDLGFDIRARQAKVRRYQHEFSLSAYNFLGRNNAFSIFYQRIGTSAIPQAYKLSVVGAIMPAFTYNFRF